MANYYYRVLEEVRGPIDAAELKEKVSQGVIVPETYIRLEKDGVWVPAGAAKNLFKTNAAPLSANAGVGNETSTELMTVLSRIDERLEEQNYMAERALDQLSAISGYIFSLLFIIALVVFVQAATAFVIMAN